MEVKKPEKKLWMNKRVKTASILQMEAVECGAASLAMIMAYWGLRIPLEKLRIECGVSRDGSKAANMLKAARKFGFEAKGFRKEPEGLHDLKLPMILFWNFNHFVVLEGIRKNRVYLNDPASGPRVVSMEEFDQAFTGVVLTFEPTPEFRKGGEKPSIIRSLKKRFTGSLPALCFTILAALFLVIPGLVVPVFSRVFVDHILVGRMDGWIKPLIVAMIVTFFIQTGLTWLQSHYLLRQEVRMTLISSAKFFQHVFQLPVTFFFQRFPGEIARRVQSNGTVANILSRDLTSSVINLGSLIFFASVMFFYDAVLTGVGIAVAMLNMLVLKTVQKRRQLMSQKLMQDQGKLIGVTMSGLQMIETLKATGGESDFFAQWAGHYAKSLNAQQTLGSNTLFMNAASPFLNTIANLSILVLGGFRVMDGHLTMGELVAFQSIMGNFLGPVNHFVSMGDKLQMISGDLNRLDDVLHYPTDNRFKKKETEAECMEKTVLSGEIEIRNVSFGYSRLAPPLIHSINIHIKPGMRIAIVGRSGSGKSTIAKLLADLYEPWEGQILFDGLPPFETPRLLMNNSLAMVDQEIFIFRGSVKENIAMWDASIPDSRIVEAAKDAAIHEEISTKPGGYEGIIAEDGGNFSGGQCQRLEIARALAVNPTVLIMDEATSALDANTEKTVMDNIKRRGCTCIVIAHRLSTIRDCDRILVMEEGKIVQEGTHEELIREEGVYANLIAME